MDKAHLLIKMEIIILDSKELIFKTFRFYKDACHGEGTYEYSDGTIYVGSWFHGMRHGIGILKIPNKKN